MKNIILGTLVLLSTVVASAHTGFCNYHEYSTGNCQVVATSWKAANKICGYMNNVVLVRADVGGGKVKAVGYTCVPAL